MNLLPTKKPEVKTAPEHPAGAGMMWGSQIHPIFLTQQEKPKDKRESTLEWISDMTRLFFEGFVKLLDIVVDACIQIARLGVWVVAICGIIIVVTIITGTSDQFIEFVNSLLSDFGVDKQLSPK